MLNVFRFFSSINRNLFRFSRYILLLHLIRSSILITLFTTNSSTDQSLIQLGSRGRSSSLHRQSYSARAASDFLLVFAYSGPSLLFSFPPHTDNPRVFLSSSVSPIPRFITSFDHSISTILYVRILPFQATDSPVNHRS
jgi:hypothetical protein